MKASPLAAAKQRFGITEKNPTEARKQAKAKLVEAVEKLTSGGLWIDRVNADKGLGLVSNQKLLQLVETLEAVKERFGSREKLVAAIIEAEGRTKDKFYATHFSDWSTPRLWDRFRSVEKSKKQAN